MPGAWPTEEVTVFKYLQIVYDRGVVYHSNTRITPGTGHPADMEMEASSLLPTEPPMRSKTEARRFDDYAMAKLGVYRHVYGKLAAAKAGPLVPSSAILGLAVAGLGQLRDGPDPVITRALLEYIVDLCM
jgi:hypothetical protein